MKARVIAILNSSDMLPGLLSDDEGFNEMDKLCVRLQIEILLLKSE